MIPEHQFSAGKVSSVFSAAFFECSDINPVEDGVDVFVLSDGGLDVPVFVFIIEDGPFVKLAIQVNPIPGIPGEGAAHQIANRVNMDLKGDVTMTVDEELGFWFYRRIDCKNGMFPGNLVAAARQINQVAVSVYNAELSQYVS